MNQLHYMASRGLVQLFEPHIHVVSIVHHVIVTPMSSCRTRVDCKGWGGEKYGIVEGRGEWGANHDEGRVGGGRSMALLRGVGSGVRTMMKEGLGGEVWHC